MKIPRVMDGTMISPIRVTWRAKEVGGTIQIPPRDFCCMFWALKTRRREVMKERAFFVCVFSKQFHRKQNWRRFECQNQSHYRRHETIIFSVENHGLVICFGLVAVDVCWCGGVILLMVQKSGEKTTWDVSQKSVNNGISTIPFPQLLSESRISGCHQQHSTGVFPRIQVPGNPVAAIFGVHRPRNLSPWRKRCSVRTGCFTGGETGMFYIVFWLVVSNSFMFTSIWGRWTHFDAAYFSNGLV